MKYFVEIEVTDDINNFDELEEKLYFIDEIIDVELISWHSM